MRKYHSVDKLIIVIAIDDGGSFFGNILWVDKSYISEEEVAAVPGKGSNSRID